MTKLSPSHFRHKNPINKAFFNIGTMPNKDKLEKIIEARMDIFTSSIFKIDYRQFRDNIELYTIVFAPQYINKHFDPYVKWWKKERHNIKNQFCRGIRRIKAQDKFRTLRKSTQLPRDVCLLIMSFIETKESQTFMELCP